MFDLFRSKRKPLPEPTPPEVPLERHDWDPNAAFARLANGDVEGLKARIAARAAEFEHLPKPHLGFEVCTKVAKGELVLTGAMREHFDACSHCRELWEICRPR